MSKVYNTLALVFFALALSACGAALPPERRLALTVTAAGYEPATLTARVGDQVFITFQNRDSVAHSLTIELPSGQRTVAVEDGVDAILTFPANEAGAFRFYCAVPGHTEEGVLVVED